MALIKLHQIDFNQTGSYTGSLYGTASYALTASYASNVPDTASFALSSSYAVSSSNSLTSSYTEGLGGSNFTQNFSNSTTWTVNHNLGNKYVIIQVYDLNYDEILPQNIDLLDNNTAVITFPTPESGTVVVTLGGALQYVYNIDTSSLTPLSVFNQFTSSYNTSSFTGSFTGDGSGLYNIPSSGITGLNLSQIASGSVTASISPSGGFRINTNTQITGSLTIQPTSSATQVVSIIQAGSGSIALIPSGSGAIMTSIPDGTAVGGNARGIYAVDLQMIRTSNYNVAGGNYSVITGGNGNSASGVGSAVLGGIFNFSSGGAAMSFGESSQASGGRSIAGGYQAIASANYAVCFGNTNTASSQNSTISGGQSNTASTNTHATVVGGFSNTSSGYASVTGGASNTNSAYAGFAFGTSNANSGNRSFVGGSGSTSGGSRSFAMGEGVTASGNYSVIFGAGGQATGAYSFANGNYAFSAGTNSISFGEFVYATLYTQHSIASGRFAATGDAQQSLLTARREATLTTATTASLSLDGTGTTNLIIPNGNNRAWHTVVDTIATVTTISGSATGVIVGDSFMQTDKLLFKRIGGTSSIVGKSTVETIYDTSMSTTAMLYTAGSSQELAITFQAPVFSGGGSITCRVVSKVSLVEVAY